MTNGRRRVFAFSLGGEVCGVDSRLDYEGQINVISKVQGVIECSRGGEVGNANDLFLKLVGDELVEVEGKHYAKFGDAEDVRA